MKSIFVSLFLILFLSGTVFAEEAGDTGDAAQDAIAEKFKKLDKNSDGFIDRKEAKADKKLARKFKKLAKKGKLDEAGYRKWASKQKMAKKSK